MYYMDWLWHPHFGLCDGGMSWLAHNRGTGGVAFTVQCSAWYILLWSLQLLLAVMVSQTFWGVLVRCFVEGFSTEICWTFFSGLDWEFGLGEEDQRGEVPFSSHYLKSPSCQHDILLLILTLITTWDGVSTLFDVKSLFKNLLCSTLWKEVTKLSPS
jgi:hypothetical protein